MSTAPGVVTVLEHVMCPKTIIMDSALDLGVVCWGLAVSLVLGRRTSGQSVRTQGQQHDSRGAAGMQSRFPATAVSDTRYMYDAGKTKTV